LWAARSRILDENGAPVGPEITGRVFVGGDLTFDGYTSGDTKDVVDDMIVSGGENVYPRAVENALAECPEVADNAAIGVEDEDYGQRLVAFVVPHPGADVREESVREFLKDRVSRFEQPRDIKIVDKIPRNPAGKVVRTELSSWGSRIQGCAQLSGASG